jgi:hypothetical protein
LHDRPQKPQEPVIAAVEHEQATVTSVELPRGAFEGVQLQRRVAETVDEPQFDLSEALLEPAPAPRIRAGFQVWPVAVLAMILLFALQAAWFNRDAMLGAYPQLSPWVEQLCARFQCTLFRQSNLAAIRIINRDVRVHPEYSDTLLVNATMANMSGQTMPYPVIQFTLFDTNGHMLGYRELTVSEYLDPSIDINKGMAPEQPVHVVLEIAAPTQDAVSFEFRFL